MAGEEALLFISSKDVAGRFTKSFKSHCCLFCRLRVKSVLSKNILKYLW